MKWRLEDGEAFDGEVLGHHGCDGTVVIVASIVLKTDEQMQGPLWAGCAKCGELIFPVRLDDSPPGFGLALGLGAMLCPL